MGITKKMSAGLLALTVMGGVSGCIPAPYEQNVPATTYTVDENGNKIKVQHHASNNKSEADKVVDAAESYFNNIMNGNHGKEMEELQAKGIEKAKEMKLDLDEDPPAGFFYDLAKESDITALKLVYTSDKVDKDEYLESLLLAGMLSSMSPDGTEMRWDKSAVSIKGGDIATLDYNRGEIKRGTEGQWEPIEEPEYFTEIPYQFIKVDGKWLLDVEDVIANEGKAFVSKPISSGE